MFEQRKRKILLDIIKENTQLDLKRHIKIKVYEDQFNVDEAFNFANKVDDILGEKLDFAFNEKLGYLTCCPVNAGTGLKTSIIVHLPILS